MDTIPTEKGSGIPFGNPCALPAGWETSRTRRLQVVPCVFHSLFFYIAFCLGFNGFCLSLLIGIGDALVEETGQNACKTF